MTQFAAGLACGVVAGALLAEWRNLRAQRRLGRFFSFAAHEINTPITAINMTVLNFVSGIFGPVPADQAPWFDILREQSVRLSGLVGELRDLVHFLIGRDLSVHIEEVDAEAAVRRAAAAVERGLAQAGSGLDLSVEADLPRIRADEERYSRTVVSLLHHARKFKAKGARLAVAVRRARDGTALEVEVAYDCLPLAAEEASRSLGLLYPADTPKGAARATGLGLGILREVMRLQGGDVTLSLEAPGRAALRLTAPIREIPAQHSGAKVQELR